MDFWKSTATNDKLRQGMPDAQPGFERPVPTDERVTLPKPDTAKWRGTLAEAVAGRRSLRAYDEGPMTLDALAFLLWGMGGVTGDGPMRRAAPSAGGKHPLEAYVLVNRVGGVAAGLYRYLPLEHALAPIDLSEDIASRLSVACVGQRMVEASACAVFWAGVLMRTYWRYGERAYRYVLLDAGHACQNLLLCAHSAGLDGCAIGAFNDGLLNAALRLDGDEAYALYGCSIGALASRK